MPAPTPATPDQLAALYLRDRDTPCPACGYNRRDATTAACPECQTPLRLGDTTFALTTRTAHTLRRVAMVSLIVASALTITSARGAYLTAQRWLTDSTSTFFAKPWFVYAGTLISIVTLAAWITLAATSLRALRTPPEAGPDRPARALITGYAALLIPAVLNAAYSAVWLFRF